MITVKNRIIPFGSRFGAINLFGVLFYKSNIALTPEVLNHERIHSCQMAELAYVGFYIIYVLEWFFRAVLSGGKFYRSYRMVSFEREAYDHEYEERYISERRHFAMWRRK